MITESNTLNRHLTFADCVVVDYRTLTNGQTRPQVAVLMPFYNAIEYFDRSMQSLASNTEPHDIILVDDGSKTPLVDQLKTWQSNVVILRLPRNLGITAALNAGLAFIASEGYPYLARMDADDWCDPRRLELQRQHLDQNRKCIVLGTWYEIVDISGRTLYPITPVASDRTLLRELQYRNCFPHAGLMLRTKAVFDSGGYDPRFLKSEDYELIRRFAESRSVAMLPIILTFVQVTPGSISSARWAQIASDLRIKLRYFDWKSPHSYLGVIRTVFSMLLSRNAATRIKQFLGRLTVGQLR